MEMSKRNYDQSQLSSNSHNPRKTWKLINSLIKGKEKGLMSPDELINPVIQEPCPHGKDLSLAISWQLL